jgi:hypothetical protein
MKKLVLLLMIISILFCSSLVFGADLSLKQGEKNTIVTNKTKQDQKIAEYTLKYGDPVYGKTAYFLSIAQKYSIPVCFIGLVLGSLNYYIIGSKKLDKKEMGFRMLILFSIGLAVFQVLPLIFALSVAGR